MNYLLGYILCIHLIYKHEFINAQYKTDVKIQHI